MTNTRTFGRRTGPQTQSRAVKRAPQPALPVQARAAAAVIDDEPSAAAYAGDHVDAELEEWKKDRRKNFRIPWRPLYLMASLCFGAASFVLPDSINSNVDYLLYALMAMSFYAGIRKRREKKAAG